LHGGASPAPPESIVWISRRDFA